MWVFVVCVVSKHEEAYNDGVSTENPQRTPLYVYRVMAFDPWWIETPTSDPKHPP